MVFDTCSEDLRESTEEIATRRGELVATEETAVLAEPLPDAAVVKDGQSDGCLADPADPSECDWSELLCETDDLLNQFSTPVTSPRRRRR